MQILFSWKSEKNISKCRLLKILARVLGYGLHKQIAHGSVHGETYDVMYEETDQPAHSEPAHQYSDQSLRKSYVPPAISGFNKMSCATSEDSGQSAQLHILIKAFADRIYLR